MPRCRVIDGKFDWNGDRQPAVPWRDSLIYELHVKGFTQLHPQVPPEWRGKYLGLDRAGRHRSPEVPRRDGGRADAGARVHERRFPARARAHQLLGLQHAGWFAPSNRYAVKDPVVELKQAVKALHKAGIEVILDVVYNHTAEGNELGPTLVVQEHRQPGLLLPSRGGPALLRRRHRLRQHGGLRSSRSCRRTSSLRCAISPRNSASTDSASISRPCSGAIARVTTPIRRSSRWSPRIRCWPT